MSTDRRLYFDDYAGGGIRDKNWKDSRRDNEDWQLYDLAKDPGETQNLTETHPEILVRLVADSTTCRAEFDQPPLKQVSRTESAGAAVK